jgi:alkanesulfonate monooxygenase SsuD/methylene tetrahydromethanopterin reductase-like flavin-dependent oxidoreductase (luciferase family)
VGSDSTIAVVVRLALKYDLRAPSFGSDISRIYSACLEQCAAADGWGFERVFLLEHHGAEDGYCPSPLTVAAAIAACTKRMRITPGALVAPFHHPLRVAEDLAVLDILSEGRLDVIIGAGYVASEFDMFGQDMSQRPKLVVETIEVLKRAWTGERFEFRGRTVRVTPTPVQVPRPMILLGGTSEAAARRAARIADGFWAGSDDLSKVYMEECKKLGHEAGPIAPRGYAPVPFESPRFIHISEDPEADWPRIAPHALHEMNSYAAWLAEGVRQNPAARVPEGWSRQTSADALREKGIYLVLTPVETIELVRRLEPDGMLSVHPLLAGMDPDLAWASLQLLADKVLPYVRAGSVPTTTKSRHEEA